MKKFIKYYKDLMKKNILVKALTILLITFLLSQIITSINRNFTRKRISKHSNSNEIHIIQTC